MTTLAGDLVGERIRSVVWSGHELRIELASDRELSIAVAERRLLWAVRRLDSTAACAQSMERVTDDESRAVFRRIFEKRQAELAAEQVVLDSLLERLKTGRPILHPPVGQLVNRFSNTGVCGWVPAVTNHHDPLWAQQLTGADLECLLELSSWYPKWVPPRELFMGPSGRVLTAPTRHSTYYRLKRLVGRGYVERQVRGNPLVSPQYNYRLTDRGLSRIAGNIRPRRSA